MERNFRSVRFYNKIVEKIYKYIYIRDGQIILQTEMAKELKISRPTIRKYIKWLEKRDLIKKDGKKFSILPR